MTIYKTNKKTDDTDYMELMELSNYVDTIKKPQKLIDRDPKSTDSHAINQIKSKNQQSKIFESENVELRDMNNIYSVHSRVSSKFDY